MNRSLRASILWGIIWWGMSTVSAKSWSRELTVIAQPGALECFFIEVQDGKRLYAHYEVTDFDSPTGNYDISMTVRDPSGNVWDLTSVSSSDSISGSAEESGDYQICLDNTFSRVAAKTVSLYIDVTDPFDDYYDDYLEEEQMEEMRKLDEEEYAQEDQADHWNKRVVELRASLNKIRMDVREASRHQEVILDGMIRDEHMAARSGEKIDFWSVVHAAAILTIGIMQVFMVKKLFRIDSGLKYRLASPALPPMGQPAPPAVSATSPASPHYKPFAANK